MVRRYKTALRRLGALCVGAGLLVGCDHQPVAPEDIAGPVFTKIIVTDPTRVLTIGVDAPAHTTVIGTVAGIVVAVDNAVIDLARATVDCRYSDAIGVWIKGDRRNVHIKGGKTGLIRDCVTGVLVGSPSAAVTEPGGSRNHIDGLTIAARGAGAYCERCDAIALFNSHDNKIDHNHIIAPAGGGILVSGSDPASAVSGRNKIQDNVLEGIALSGIQLSSNLNVVRDNAMGGYGFLVRVSGDSNWIDHNQLSMESFYREAYGVYLDDGANENLVKRNVATAGTVGFCTRALATGNLIRQNRASGASYYDAYDQGDPGACRNSWTKNTFGTAYPTCILGPADVPAGTIYFEDWGGGGIFKIRPDGSGVTFVTAGREPAVAPNGLALAFLCGADICTVNADGTNRVQITTEHGYSQTDRPDWSPTGDRLVFAFVGDLWISKADGTERLRVTAGPDEDDAPTWSPDGEHILFTRTVAGTGASLYTVHPDGSGITRIGPSTEELWAAWSPDGARIAYSRMSYTGFDVFVMNADGSGVVQLTTDATYNDLAPSWSPDGKWLAFASNRAGTMDVYIMRSDGSDVRRLTSGPDYEGFPAWVP